MLHEPIIIAFPKISAAEANRCASDLAATLHEMGQGLTVEQRRARKDTQDLGTTLVIVLGTASATAVAKGLAIWLMRHSGVTLEISRDGKVKATNLDSRDAAKIAEVLSRPE